MLFVGHGEDAVSFGKRFLGKIILTTL